MSAADVRAPPRTFGSGRRWILRKLTPGAVLPGSGAALCLARFLNYPGDMVSRTTVLLLLVALGGCSAKPLETPSDAGPTTGPACAAPPAARQRVVRAAGYRRSLLVHGAAAPTTSCTATSSLLGVTLAFPDDRCSYTQAEVAAGIQIQYQVVVAQNLTGVHPNPADAGGCMQPGASGLIVGYAIGGGGQSYCVCDTGLCAPQSPVTTPRVGTYPAQIAWDGRNWSGPSDTGNPKGAPFPPGTYTLTLT